MRRWQENGGNEGSRLDAEAVKEGVGGQKGEGRELTGQASWSVRVRAGWERGWGAERG